MSELARPNCPYVGLTPFTEEQAEFFFGRERQRQIIAANLHSYRLTLLYGTSGVGKTSVLRAGVVRHLRDEAKKHVEESNHPECVPVYFSNWLEDPIAGLSAAIDESVSKALDNQIVEPISHSASLVDVLGAWTERLDAQLLVILDQFEDYFLYHPNENGDGTFAFELPRAIKRPDLRVSFLISIRDDAVAKLDRFKGHIPDLFDNYLRIKHLDRRGGEQAILGPLRRSFEGADIKDLIEEDLVDAVLQQVRSGATHIGRVGSETVPLSAKEHGIETPFLQLVMTRLWGEERRLGSTQLRKKTLDSLGESAGIVGTHLDRSMAALRGKQSDAAAKIFDRLVTPSGVRIAFKADDLAKYVVRKHLEPTLKKLEEERILRNVDDRYEILHDVLAEPVLKWCAGASAQKKRRTRFWWMLGSMAVGLVVGLSVMIFVPESFPSIFRLPRATQLVDPPEQSSVKMTLTDEKPGESNQR